MNKSNDLAQSAGTAGNLLSAGKILFIFARLPRGKSSTIKTSYNLIQLHWTFNNEKTEWLGPARRDRGECASGQIQQALHLCNSILSVLLPESQIVLGTQPLREASRCQRDSTSKAKPWTEKNCNLVPPCYSEPSYNICKIIERIFRFAATASSLL